MKLGGKQKGRMTNERLPYQQDEEAPVAKIPARVSDLTVTAGGNRLGEMLVDANLVSGEQIAEALKLLQSSSGKRLGRLLVELGTLDERGLARMLARQHGLEFVDLREVRPDPAATELLSETTARELTAIPLRVENDLVVVAVSDPVEKTLEILRLNLGRSVKAAVATPSDIQRAIGNSYRALAGVTSQVQAFEVTSPGLRAPVRAEVMTATDQAPIVQVVQMVITQGLRDRASDIHIEPQAERIRVRYRIDGALHDVLDLPGTMGPGMVSRIKILGGMNIVERRRPQDGQIGTEIEGRALDIRVSTTATIWGEKVVMRLLDKSRPLFKLSDLGMPEDTVQRYSALLHSPYGMVICVGPTGSGKTTTLYGSLGEINDPERNIMTIEDPVEYTFPSINQIQINVQAGVTFASGLKSILRQDPDVILIGEVRDVETARIAVQSALTGHFVLSSVHATDSASAMHRLLDMGIEDFLVASSVTAVVAQRLVRRICDHCRTAYQPSAEELSFLRTLGGTPPEEGFAHGAGCNFCANTGYLDRTGVYELMTVTDRIRELILERASHDDLRKLARAEGMRSLQDESVRLVESGVTTLAEVLRSVYVSAS
jgi:type IV pilus assembly protein PilB